MNSHYDLKALDEQGRRRWLWAETLNLILKRLNALENYAGEPLSRWYGTDPRTGLFYGAPGIGAFAHLRIDYTGSPERCYIRDRVDQLREKIQAPAFPWKYTPGIEDFDTPPHRLCGPQAAGWLEMLQAIGRRYGSSSTAKEYYIHHTKEINEDGKVTETDSKVKDYARAFYRLWQSADCNISQDAKAGFQYNRWNAPQYFKSTSGDFDFTITHYGSGGKKDGLRRRSTLKIVSSKRVNMTTQALSSDSGYDWVEDEGEKYVLVLGGTGVDDPNYRTTIGGSYLYHGAWVFNSRGYCYGGQGGLGTVTQHDIINHPSHTDSGEGIIGDGSGVSHQFTPEFTVLPDGSVTPVIPADLPIGDSASDDEGLVDLLSAATTSLESYKDHVSVDHLIATYDGVHDSNHTEYFGVAALNTTGSIGIEKQVGTVYERQVISGGGSGWLLWTAPFIPTHYGGYPNNLKAGGSL